MDNYSYQRAKHKHMTAHAQHAKAKAMEPQIRHCFIREIDVNILVEYPDYKHKNAKGPEGEIFCEHILYCFQQRIKCRWSGISPLYPNPFDPYAPRHNQRRGDVL